MLCPCHVDSLQIIPMKRDNNVFTVFTSISVVRHSKGPICAVHRIQASKSGWLGTEPRCYVILNVPCTLLHAVWNDFRVKQHPRYPLGPLASFHRFQALLQNGMHVTSNQTQLKRIPVPPYRLRPLSDSAVFAVGHSACAQCSAIRTAPPGPLLR